MPGLTRGEFPRKADARSGNGAFQNCLRTKESLLTQLFLGITMIKGCRVIKGPRVNKTSDNINFTSSVCHLYKREILLHGCMVLRNCFQKEKQRWSLLKGTNLEKWEGNRNWASVRYYRKQGFIACFSLHAALTFPAPDWTLQCGWESVAPWLLTFHLSPAVRDWLILSLP